MLIIYDKSVSFDRNDTNMFFDSLGYGVLTDLVSDPLITEELNGSYILEFEYKKDGKLSEYLVEENIIKAHGEPFSIYSIDKKINNRISVLARHWVLNEWDKDFLIDVAPTKLSAYNALKWIQERSVNKSNINISGNCENISSARYVNKTMLESIFKEDNAILTKFGGELSYSKNNVFINNRRGSLSGLTIRQGKNISGAEYYLDFTTVTTRLVPVGKDGLMLPNKFVDSPLINNYATPIVRKIEVDTDNITELENYCNKLYESGLDKPTISVKIDFVELSKTTEYKKYSSLETAHLGDTVVAYIPSLGLNFSTRIVKTVYNDNLKRITSIELGTIMPNIAINNVKIQNSISQIANLKSSILDKAKQDASSLIKHPFEGYLYIDDSTGTLYIMDTNDISTAKNIWRWGLGGLGFSSTGIDGTYGIAITQDGKIVADYILTGTLSADRIEGYNELLLNVSSINTQIIPTATVSGSNIHIEDASDKKMVNFEIEGKCEQETSSQSANLCPPFTDSRWTFTNGVSVTNEGYLSIPANSGARAVINIPWNKSRTCYFKDIIVSGGNAHYAGEYFDESGTLLSSNGKAIFDKDANYQDGTMWGGNNQYGDALIQTTNIKFTIQFSNYTPNHYVIKDLIISENDINYIPFTPNMPSPDYPSELVSVGYKNELYNTATTQTVNGITYTKNDDDSITLNGTATSASYIKISNLIPLHGTFTLSGGERLGSNIYMRGLDYNDNYAVRFNTQPNKSSTATVNSDRFLFYLYVSSNTTVNNVTVYPQLTKGSQVHSYIPYGKYGIEVETVGRNIWDEQWELGLYSIANGSKADSTTNIRSKNYISCLPNTNYYLKANVGNRVCFYDKNKNFISIDFDKQNTIFTTPSNCYYMTFNLGSAYGTTYKNDVCLNISDDKNGEYQPHQSNTLVIELNAPLRSLPNGVKDIAYIKNNILYVDRKVGSRVFDGSEGWGTSTALHDGYMRFSLNAPPIKGQNRAMSNYFKIGNTSSTSVENLLEYRDTNVIFINTNVAQNLSGFKTWLSTHNTQVDYELAEPYTEKIGEIEIPGTFKGVNNITTTDELEPVMNIEYVRDTILSDYVEGQVNSSQVTLRNEMNAKFVLQQENIDLELSKKVNDNEIIASINMSTEKMEDGSSMQIQADKLNLKGKKFNLTTDEITIESENFSVSKDGKISSKGGEIGGFEIETDKFSNSISETYNFTENDYTKVKNYIMGTEDLTDEEIELYDINGDGKVSSSDYVKIKNMFDGLISNIINGTLEINSKSSKRTIVLRDSEGKIVTSLGLNGSTTPSFSCDEFYIGSEKQPSIQSGTSLPTEVKNGVVFLLYDE